MKRLLWLIQVFFLYIFTFPLAVLPLSTSLKAGSIIGLVFYHLWRGRRTVAIENLSYACRRELINDRRPPAEIIKDNFRNLGMSLSEIIKIYHGFGEGVLKKVDIRGLEHYRKAREKGSGVLIITGHCGNWELLGLTASYRVSPFSVVARPIKNPYLNRLVARVRNGYGNRVIYKKGALRAILTLFREGGSVGILIDQSVMPDEGVVVEFLGRPAWTTKVPALLARKTGVPVLPVFIKRTDSGHVIEVKPEVRLSAADDSQEAIIEDTRMFASFIEEYVRENPAEWLWIHRRWKRV